MQCNDRGWETRIYTCKVKGFNCVRTALEEYGYYLGYTCAPDKIELISNELSLLYTHYEQ